MRLKQNPIVKALAVLMVIVPVYFFATESNDEEVVVTTDDSTNSNKPAVTENEAIAAMSGYLSTVEDEQKIIKSKLDDVVTKEEIAELINSSQSTTSINGIDEDKLLEKLGKVVDSKFEAAKKTILSQSQINQGQVGNVDKEMPFSDAFEVNTSALDDSSAQVNSEKIQWDYPVGYVPDEKGGIIDGLLGTGSSFGNSAGQFAGEVKDSAVDARKILEDELKPIPYATIHSDSSIHNATSLTALIGRIERKGQTHDPFRFQIMLSGETLMANGHSMPGVANALVSGVGVGDMAFSCVRGRITSITFNFDDGRIYNQKGTYEKPIAELGDRWGNPCIKGHKVDDVEKYLAAQGIVAGLSNYAETISKQQQTLTSSGNSTNLSLSGDAGKLAAGSIASGGLNKTSEMLSERYENYYEAIYVAPGEKVSLFFVEDVPIDYIPTNRKVSYDEKINYISALD